MAGTWTNFFAGCATVTEVKTRYRTLAMENHPDRGGDTRTMQEINRQYQETLSRMDGCHERGSDGEQHTYYYNQAQEQAVMDKLGELLRMHLAGCEIWLIGKWLWVKGDTKPYKAELKAAGLSWHQQRVAWYWKPYEGRTRYNGRADFSTLAATYGARVFDGEQSAPLAAAA